MTQCDIQKSERERESKRKKEKWTKNKYDTIRITHHNLLHIDGNCTVFSDITFFRLFDLKNPIVIALEQRMLMKTESRSQSKKEESKNNLTI